MRTFRITLSHGNESITFDGAGARSGSMFHVRRDAIEGLWSSPASKVSLTERETANGASPISDGETLYAARTVVIPFAIQSNCNHTDLIRARILLGRLLGWHDVRMDVNDDGDETVLYGYIEAKYSNIPYDHADTGTITMVCPDPRRVSKNASTVTMNTSSSSLGGLSFVMAHAYEIAWTGTPNASTSTLSQGGQVVATNIIPCPMTMRLGDRFDFNPLNFRQSGNGTCENVSLPDCPIPITTGIHVSGFDTGACIDDKTLEPGDYVFAVWAKAPVGALIKLQIGWDGSTTHGDAIYRGDGTWHRYTVTGQIVAATISYAYMYNFTGDEDEYFAAPFFCTAADWQTLQSLGVNWFSGDSQPPQPNAGLSFPLNFGQTGNAGNTGMIVNNGSYTAMPVITAHGWLDSGLIIHWTTSDGNEGDLSYKGSIHNVPVTINTDTHSAIMGGLDVSYLLGSRDWPRIPAGGSCSFALLASGSGWVTVQSHDTYM